MSIDAPGTPATESDALVPMDREATASTANAPAADLERKPARPPPAALQYVVGSLVAALSALFLALLFQGRGDLFGPETGEPCFDTGSCGPVIRVALGWLCLYFCFLFFQSLQRFRTGSGKPITFGSPIFAGEPRADATRIGDRTTGNMVEQSVPFLFVLVLHAMLVDSGTAAQLGWWWLLFRAPYPVAYAWGIPYLFISTLPGYALLAALAWPLAGLACSEACGAHGSCVDGGCLCDTLVEGKRYAVPWTGSTCDTPPVGLDGLMECCTTWCPANEFGVEAEVSACEAGFGCCEFTGAFSCHYRFTLGLKVPLNSPYKWI